MNNYEHLKDGLGLWSELISKNENLENRPALFLDRDGTVGQENTLDGLEPVLGLVLIQVYWKNGKRSF